MEGGDVKNNFESGSPKDNPSQVEVWNLTLHGHHHCLLWDAELFISL
jgi:hypothetical protein